MRGVLVFFGGNVDAALGVGGKWPGGGVAKDEVLPWGFAPQTVGGGEVGRCAPIELGPTFKAGVDDA